VASQPWRRGELGSVWRLLEVPGRTVCPKPWASEVVWTGARRLASQVASAGVRTPPVGMVQGRSEVGDDVSGSFVIFSKSKNQFCKFNFSPSSWLQMKNL